MQIHDPIFSELSALYIIWADDPLAGRESVAAGCFAAMDAAWSALQTEYPTAELTFQQRARVMRRRPPLR